MIKDILFWFIPWVIPTLLPDEAPIKVVDQSNDDIEEDSPSSSATDDDDSNDPEHASVQKEVRAADQYDYWQPLTPTHCAEEKHLYQLHENPEITKFSLPVKPRFDRTEPLHSLVKLKFNDDSPEAEDDFSDEKDVPVDVTSSGTLSADNLSVDARACALPKRKPKKGKEKSKKHGHSHHKHDAPDAPEKQMSKHEAPEKKSSATNSKDLDDFIRNLAIQNSLNSRRPEIKFFDAAIVYDKNDYDEALGLKNDIWEMVKRELGEDLKIELFDSEEFAQSKVLVVEDVVNRCSVILVYLTDNFTSKELTLFVEEAIGMSRLGLGGASSFENRWVLKPVHTDSSKSRRYKTPTGLLTVNGIDWFDRWSAHTKGQIISTMRSAIALRKQRSVEENTTKTYTAYFGKSAQPPTFGPPFNQQVLHKQATASGSGKMMYNQEDFHQLMSHQSRDQFSLPPGYSVPTVQHGGHQTYQPLGPHFGNSATLHVSQPNTYAQGFNSAEALLRPPHPINNMGQPNMMINPVQLQTNQVANQFMPQLPLNPTYQQPIQTNVVYQSAGLQRQSSFQNYQPAPNQPSQYPYGSVRYHPQGSNQLLGYPSRDHMATHDGFQQYSASQRNVLPNERQISYDSDRNPPMNFQNQPFSRDALHSESGNYLRDQRHDTPNHSQLSVVSRVNGKLITNPNLSTDDVEVDHLSGVLCDMSKEFTSSTSSLSKLKGSGRGKKHHTTNKERVNHVESEDTSDSDVCSSDEDYSAMVVKKIPVKTKVYNVVGCRIVQMGKGNKVKESGRKAHTACHNHERSDMKEKESKELSEDHPSVGIKQVKTTINEKRISKDSTKDMKNESVEKDAMSLERKLSENLLSADVWKPTLNKSIVVEAGSNSIQLGDSGNHNPDNQINRLNSVDHSSEHQESEEKCSLQMNVFLNEQDGVPSSMEDNQYTPYTSSEELNLSDNQLFGSGSLSNEPQYKLQEYFHVLQNEQNDIVHEEFDAYETPRQANGVLNKRPGQTMHEDKKAFFVLEAARQTNMFSVFSKCDYKYNLTPINVYSDSDEVD